MLNKLLFLIVILLTLAPSSIGQEVPLSADQAIAFRTEAMQAAAKIETIASDFVQKKHLDFLANDIETFGKMLFKAPGLIKWEYTEPFEYSVLFKDDKLFINDGGNKSDVDLTKNKTFQSLNDLIAKSIKGDLFDEERFDISYFKNEGDYLVRFLPKDRQLREYIKAFELSFDGKTANVTSVKIVEPTDDYTHIIFKNRQINGEVPDEEFRL